MAVLSIAALLCIAAASWAWQSFGPGRDWAPQELPPPDHVLTNTYRVDIDRWQLPEGTRRASLDVVGANFVLSSNDGTLYTARRPAHGRNAELHWKILPFSIPTQIDVFEKKLGEWGYALGVRDIFVRVHANAPADLFALYGSYSASGDCIVTRVGRIENFVNQGAGAQVQILYETLPCLPVEGPVDRVGGRLAVRDDQLFVTLGTPVNDQKPQDLGDPTKSLSQDWDSPFGKVIQIDLETKAVTHLTAGHRNPQGLFLAQDGRIWVTEHGPKGGDELNLLRAAANYGWPVVTYGTSYPGFTWPPSMQPGRHEGYERPVYAWVPSIGISQLVGLEDPIYARWHGDLLITSLNGKTLYRTRVEDDRVIFAEPIALGHRLRDIVAVDGMIYIATDFDLIVRLSPDYTRD
jgi:hypothetical protein